MCSYRRWVVACVVGLACGGVRRWRCNVNIGPGLLKEHAHGEKNVCWGAKSRLLRLNLLGREAWSVYFDFCRKRLLLFLHDRKKKARARYWFLHFSAPKHTIHSSMYPRQQNAILARLLYLHSARFFSELDQVLRREVGVHDKESRLRHPACLLHRVGKNKVHPNFGLDGIELGRLRPGTSETKRSRSTSDGRHPT